MPKPLTTQRAYQLTVNERRRTRQIAAALSDWARTNVRAFPWRSFRSDYEVLVAETLLQRTRAEVVAKFLPAFLRDYPSWGALARAEPTALKARLAALGLQERRSSSLRAMAEAHLVGSASLPGVGQYIQRARAVMVDNASLAMVDSNFVRVLQRAFEPPWSSDYRYDARLQGLAQAIVDSGTDPRRMNMALLDLGGLVCAPRKPRCPQCPLVRLCAFSQTKR